jgi:hypothetical protein
MVTDSPKPSRPEYLVYGADKVNVPLFARIDASDGVLTFAPYGAAAPFDRYAGVVLFQGIFEDRARRTYDSNALNKRINEMKLLIDKGGFICFLLYRPLLINGELTPTDMPSCVLDAFGIQVYDLPAPSTAISAKQQELSDYLSRYGAASSVFTFLPQNEDVRPLAMCSHGSGEHAAALVADARIYFVPSVLPDPDPTELGHFFRTLVSGLVLTTRRLNVELPEWAHRFVFKTETPLQSDRSQHLALVDKIDTDLQTLDDYKWALAGSGEKLVEAVAKILSVGFGLSVDGTDEFREDLKLLNPRGKPAVFVEVKGTARGIKRENVNQADSHRERACLPSSFPTVLIQNTHNNAKSLKEKAQEIPSEQVQHAVALKILVLRTLDLVRLLDLHLANPKSGVADTFMRALMTQHGWLRVEGSRILIDHGKEGVDPECIAAL